LPDVGKGVTIEEKGSLLLSQSLLQWNSAQFSASLETLTTATTLFLDSAAQAPDSSEVRVGQFSSSLKDFYQSYHIVSRLCGSTTRFFEGKSWAMLLQL
jgi:hypothetical protein